MSQDNLHEQGGEEHSRPDGEAMDQGDKRGAAEPPVAEEL